ncbi:MAG: hypothetical protein U0802_01035 [Candidatus Binatia bacterium]
MRDMSFSPRYLVVVNLLLLALAAYSASSIVGTALAARLIPPPDVEISPPPPPIEIEPAKPATYYAVIHKRDIFNSVKPTPAPAPVQEAAPTQLKLKLWGTAVFDKGSSFSIIEDLGARKQGVYAVNDAWCQATRPSSPSNGTGGALAQRSRRGAGAGGGRGHGQDGGCAGGSREPRQRQASSRSPRPSTMPRTEVDSALENMSQLFTRIRAIAAFRGAVRGVRSFAIRRGTATSTASVSRTR